MKVCVKIANFSLLAVNLIEIHIQKLRRNFFHKETRRNINKLNRKSGNNNSKNLIRYSTMFLKHIFEGKNCKMVLKTKSILNLPKQREQKLSIYLVLSQIQPKPRPTSSLQISLRFLRLHIKTMGQQTFSSERSDDIFSFNHSLFISLIRYYRVTQN